MASRDEQLQTLFESSSEVTKVLEERSEDIVDLMGNSDLVFKELQKRKQAVHDLLVNARSLAVELEGVAKDNEEEIGPAMEEVDQLLDLLVDKRDQLKATLHQLGPVRGDPQQHHRHRPLVRRHGDQPHDPPGRAPARRARVRPGFRETE